MAFFEVTVANTQRGTRSTYSIAHSCDEERARLAPFVTMIECRAVTSADGTLRPPPPTQKVAAPAVQPPPTQSPTSKGAPVAANPFPVQNLSIGGVLRGIGRGVTSVIPGPIDDAIFEGITGLVGGNGRNPAVPQTCQPPFIRDQSGICVMPGSPGDVSTDRATGTVTRTTGLARMGGVPPQAVSTQRLRCPRGMVLGFDELCYDSRSLPKRDRKWVPGRKPLLTGGDLNAISRAARAAKRVETQTKRLQKLGMLKKPKRGSSGRSSRPDVRYVQSVKIDD